MNGIEKAQRYIHSIFHVHNKSFEMNSHFGSFDMRSNKRALISGIQRCLSIYVFEMRVLFAFDVFSPVLVIKDFVIVFSTHENTVMQRHSQFRRPNRLGVMLNKRCLYSHFQFYTPQYVPYMDGLELKWHTKLWMPK